MEQEINQKFDELLTAVKQGFDEVSDRFDEVYTRFDKVDVRLDTIEGRLDNLEHDMKVVKCTMVTKDFLTEKQANFAAEVGRRMRLMDEREKLFSKKLLEYLKESKVLAPERVAELEDMLA